MKIKTVISSGLIMDQKRSSFSDRTDVSVVCKVCCSFIYFDFLEFYQVYFWYMVRLGIRAIFLKHQYVPERRDAGTNTDEHRPHHVALVKPATIPDYRLGTSQPLRVTRTTSSVVS